METTTRLLLPEVIEALRTDPKEIVELAEELHPADLADLAAALEEDLQHILLEVLPIEIAARLLEFCEKEQRNELFAALAKSRLPAAVAITDEMAADERADLFADLSNELRTQLLDAIPDEDSRDIRQLLAYPEGTAGAWMTTDFVAVPANATVSEAIEIVRRDAEHMETIYYGYAIDPNGTLLGAVSLRDLVVSKADRTIDQIMKPDIVSIAVDADQEEAARLIAKYDLLALPVVDRSQKILGINTVDDVMDVVEEEATEDAQRMGAVEPLETPYHQTPVRSLVRARAPWLIALFIASSATANVLEHYSATVATMLLMFVPLVISTGGNSGSQSSTLMIRALAVGRIHRNDAARILTREIMVSLLLGVIVGTVAIARVLIDHDTRSAPMVAAIFFSVLGIITFGSMAGSVIPLLLRRLGIDPAVASAPFIASMSDVLGLVIYFEIARLFVN
jgi:magnesium transporter